jgi:hypothetical protein
MVLTKVFLISILFFNTLHRSPDNKNIFISPVRIPLLLSSNFGELRIDHYHSGLDIKTQGVTGKEVVAAADGYVYRIGVSPGGFGKVLYVKHPSGYSTVYGHLDKFTPEIEQYVIERQYENKSFQVALFLTKDIFQVKQGDLIGFSGNSGSSGGPHLHYEIRKSENEMPVNPLQFEFGTKDTIKPVIEKLAIYPINNYSDINGKNELKTIDTEGKNGKYSISEENGVSIGGMAGFGIKSFDMLNDSPNKCSIYSIELNIDSVPVFRYKMDGFSFSESRYINSHIDYETYIRNGIYIERAFALPNDRLSVYKEMVNRGIFNFKDGKVYRGELIVKDIHGNKSTLLFKIKGTSTVSPDSVENDLKNLKIMPYGRSNKFDSENISVRIPAGALYDTLLFKYRKSEGTKEMFSDIHVIHNLYTPLHKPYSLSIRPSRIPPGKESKMIIVQLTGDLKRKASTGIWADGHLTAEVQSFGKYYIGIDTISPSINVNGLVSGADLSEKKVLKITIADELSGIKSYEGIIDGKWALFEYDQKNDLIIYRFDENRITRGAKHNLSLTVIDNVDNKSRYNCDFTW